MSEFTWSKTFLLMVSIYSLLLGMFAIYYVQNKPVCDNLKVYLLAILAITYGFVFTWKVMYEISEKREGAKK